MAYPTHYPSAEPYRPWAPNPRQLRPRLVWCWLAGSIAAFGGAVGTVTNLTLEYGDFSTRTSVLLLAGGAGISMLCITGGVGWFVIVVTRRSAHRARLIRQARHGSPT